MNLKKVKLILSALVILIVLLLVTAVVWEMKAVYYLCVVAAVIYMVLYFKLWRCPYCGKVLGRSGGTCCPHCEEDIKIRLRIP